LIVWLTLWLLECLSVWMFVWLFDALIDYNWFMFLLVVDSLLISLFLCLSVVWLFECLNGWMVECFKIYCTSWLFADCLTIWLDYNWLMFLLVSTDWKFVYFFVFMCLSVVWLFECLNGWMFENLLYCLTICWLFDYLTWL
jgi:hypothetical protein